MNLLLKKLKKLYDKERTDHRKAREVKNEFEISRDLFYSQLMLYHEILGKMST